ncbi:MAG: hypothetical protein AAB225_05060 [Acidobacteriota bacterium]
MRIRVNLANEPFQHHRPMLVASGVTAVLLAALLALLIFLAVQESGRLADTRAAVGRIEAQARALATEQAGLEALLRRPDNAEVLEHSQFYNAMLYRKGISWTKIFDDLEKVMPHNVRLISVRPQVNAQNEVLLDMVVGSESSEPVVVLLTRLEGSPEFGATYVHNRLPPSQSEPLLRYRISVKYGQNL